MCLLSKYWKRGTLKLHTWSNCSIKRQPITTLYCSPSVTEYVDYFIGVICKALVFCVLGCPVRAICMQS